jgi:hypothetical protein
MPGTETVTLSGKIIMKDLGEASDILFLDDEKEGDENEPMAKQLQDLMDGRQVSVRYWITEEKISKEQAQISFLKSIMGLADFNYSVCYSEATGYLWTNEDGKVGGHDFIEEIRESVGKYLIMEIDIH